MKHLSKIVLAIFIAGIFFSILYISCNKDKSSAVTTVKCDTITCLNNGVSDSSKCNCICPAGYEGTNCETASRDKFIGNWNVFEKGSVSEAAQYAITIQKSTQVTDVVIKNFYNYFQTPIKGSVINDTLFIPNQEYEGKVVFGIGFIYSSTTYGQFGQILMRYEVIDTATQQVNDFGYYAPDLSDPSSWVKL